MEKTSGHSNRRVFVILMLAAVILCMLLLPEPVRSKEELTWENCCCLWRWGP